MRNRMSVVVVVAGIVAGTLAAAPSASAAAGPATAPAHAVVSGSGSTWAGIAMDRWRADVRPQGLVVNYSANGSGAGRQDFVTDRVDFAVADLTYADNDETNPSRAFTYLPLAAGAIAFPYQVRVAGTLKRDVRLSGATLAGIFSGGITNWNDPRITADNNGHRVAPNLPITPVIRSDGSATSYHLTDWFSTRFATQWRPFSDAGATPFFPPAGGRTIAANGSASAIARVMQDGMNGAIGYVENSFAVNAGAPVTPLENASGHFLAPDSGNVSLALLRATIDATGEADLHPVFANTDPRAYPLSYYTYGILSTAHEASTSTGKRQTEVDFFGHDLCAGQSGQDGLGYAALPLNLTRAGLRAVAQLKRTDPAVDLRALALSRCANPTIAHAADGSASDGLDATVPPPPACSAAGSGPCARTTAGLHRRRS